MLPDLPDMHGLAVLTLTAIALFLFTRDRIPLETSSLAILILLVLGFQLFPYERDGVSLRPSEFLSGFGHEALVTICALMIVGKGLETTGALQPLAAQMARAWSARPGLAFFTTLFIAAVLSAFLNNTPIVVMLLPMLVAVALRTRIGTSGMLMPMGFATIIGGMATTIGTSTNLLVVAIAADLGERRFEMFDFLEPVAFAGGFGLLFLWLVAPRLLPARQALLTDTSPRIFSALLYVNEDSFANGKSLAELLARTEQRMRVARVQRGHGLFVAKLPSVKLQVGDRLLVNDTRENLKEFERLLGATLHNVPDVEQTLTEEFPVTAEKQQLAEVVVMRGSALHQRTLNATQFATRYKLLPLALHRPRAPSAETAGELGDVRLRAGDVILVQGNPENIRKLKEGGTMMVMDGTTDLPHTQRTKLALYMFLFVVVTAATGLLPISVSAMTGVGLMLLTRCLTWRDAAGALSTPVILIIVVSLALGFALMITGGAEFVAQLFVTLTRDLPTPVIISGLMLLMAILTNVVSNNAAAVIGTPIAISIAQQLGAPAEPFVLAVLFGANMSFATPIGYQTNLLVMSAGGYKFGDFLRIGIPLTLVMWLGFSFILPVLYLN